MKNCFFALLAVAAVAMAGSVTFTATDNGDGTATVSYSADAAVVGFALDVDSDVDVTDVAIPSFFDVFMDYANEEGESYVYGEGGPIAAQDAAGTASLPSAAFCISAGGLEDDETDVPSTSGDIVVTTGAAASVTIGENALRGGVVDYDGAMDTNLPITFDITDGGTEPPECAAYDLDGNNFVNAEDITALVNYINNNGSAPFWSIAVDESNGAYDVDGNGFINAEDITATVNYINNNGSAPFWSISCDY
ncbi:dockerin type I domain-containing protein [Sedimentisphaera salicampi]|uniref:Dockerin domain-containing protein n=1 Tax=Sedimentisphaera salicampi TaxID=1941349 RepID=A0A1W6LNK3_9BACT|nr:dockerin type I domain-containing protein [Sedimentisphaera salicampi]ARN57313.1 hypothetical protein STSP1_01717 [Sedimentisphaera salicampi]